MSVSRPIYWHQGMFLQPQHFQLSEQHGFEQIKLIREHLAPFLWGFNDLHIQNESLALKKVEISDAEIFFQDGTHAKLNENAWISPKSIAGIEFNPESPTTLYVAMKKSNFIGDNVTIIDDLNEVEEVKTRYFSLSDPEEVTDQYSNADTALVQRLTLKLELVLESEKDRYSNYELVPFAQIIVDGENILYSPSYIPPTINIGGTSKLSQELKELRDELAGRAIQLHNSQSMMGTVVDTNSLKYRMALQALSRMVPKLFHQTEAQQIHPWHLYGTIRELIGELSTFSNDINFLGEADNGEQLLPNYNHTDIAQCITKGRQLINRLLNEISVGPQLLLELERSGDLFSVDIASDFFDDHADYYLVFNTKEPWHEHSSTLLTSAKLASSETVSVLVERSLPGIGLMHVPNVPTGLPKKDFAHYVRIDAHSEEWLAVQSQQSISLFWDTAPDDLVVEMVILKR